MAGEASAAAVVNGCAELRRAIGGASTKNDRRNNHSLIHISKMNRREKPAFADQSLVEECMPENKTPAKRGFAAMSAEKQREIASKGGKASHGGGRKPKVRVDA